MSAVRLFGELRKHDATPWSQTSPQSVRTQAVRGKHVESELRSAASTSIDLTYARTARREGTRSAHRHAKWTSLSSKACRVKREGPRELSSFVRFLILHGQQPPRVRIG